jgi:AraC-like DNA-binding protein
MQSKKKDSPVINFNSMSFVYKNGFYELPYVANDPHGMIEEYKKMPFITYNPKNKSLSAKMPVLNIDLFYRKIKDLFIIHSQVKFKANVSFKHYQNEAVSCNYYCLSLRNDSYAKNINSMANDVGYTDNSWLIFKPGAKVNHHHFNGTKGSYFSIYFTREWLKNYIKQISPNQKKTLNLFLKAKTDHLICPNLPQNLVYDADKLRRVIIYSNPPHKKLENELQNFIFFFLSKMQSENINKNHYRVTNLERIKILRAEKVLQKYIYKKFPGIQFIATEVGLSETILKQCFKKVYGTTLFQYFQNMQLTKAKELISTGKFKIAEVSNKMGYQNASKFAAAFKQNMGVSPSQISQTT